MIMPLAKIWRHSFGGWKNYYIEMLHVDAGYANRIEVALKLPGTKSFQIIENQFLLPFLPTSEPFEWFKYIDSVPQC